MIRLFPLFFALLREEQAVEKPVESVDNSLEFFQAVTLCKLS